ncbi:SET domain-containing protein-lysine N-methyltransferase [Lewinella sp. 4G2]|uniref:SET domain-containing protein-lysine N-methyltransferase n=1 Tax=Lewinella sp. 4G2 TaxID=1803372 RepID=UPI0007B49D76|nr:SET domain-containing protein-lysine N-methyltransferase [Lewinella sp. 4G2]OAV44079.1 hypothetical protein A3850_006015 [Lewinella sp. 4G2]
MLHLPSLYVQQTANGRGVFTSAAIPAGGIIELSPVIIVSAADREKIHHTVLHDYYFQWDGDRAAIALGLGSLYNHSERANAEFEMDYAGGQIRFTAVRDIREGEEVTTDYRVGDPEMTLWF